MSAQEDQSRAAIDNARALLDSFLQSEWQELHIASADGFELFIAREGGGPNPIFGVDEPTEGSLPAPAPARSTVEIAAPHVATVAWVAKEGAAVASGDAVVRLSVLDEETELTTERGGRIAAVEVEEGQLVEFGTIVLRIAEKANR